MNLTVVIPAKNEESNLEQLLGDIRRQISTNVHFTVIVSDANSTDRTVKVARSYFAKVIQGGLPATGRNNGAKYTTTEYLLFIDADVRLYDPWLFEKSLRLMIDKDLWMVTTNTFAESKSLLSRTLYQIASLAQRASKYVWKPFATGMFMLVRRNIFFQLGGFDETILYAEDYYLTKQIPRKKFGVVSNSAVYTSDRRLRKLGNLKVISLFVKSFLNTWNSDFFRRDQGYWKKTPS